MNSRRLRLGAATAISVVAASLAATTTPTSFAADCFTTVPTPTITGLVRVGDDLTAHPGSWDPTPALVLVTWYVGGVVVEGNPDDGGGPYHGLVYPIGGEDAGKPVKIEVTASRDGCSTTAVSEPTIDVHPADYNTGPIADPPTPSLGGDFTVGKVVTAAPGTWPAGTTIEQYRWYVVRRGPAPHPRQHLRSRGSGSPAHVRPTHRRQGRRDARLQQPDPVAAVHAVRLPSRSAR